MIGNIPSNTNVLIMQVENDSQTPIEQRLFLQQKINGSKGV